MKYANIKTDVFHRREFMAATDQQRGVWISLLVYCCLVENGGRIAGLKTWGRTEIRALGVRPSALFKPSSLWRFENDDLVLSFYPIENESEIQKRRSIIQNARQQLKKKESTKERRIIPPPHICNDNNNNDRAIDSPIDSPIDRAIDRTSNDCKSSTSEKIEDSMVIPTEKIFFQKFSKTYKNCEKVEGSEDANIPSLDEVIGFGQLSGIPPEYCRNYWHTKSEKHGWVANHRLIDWKRQIVRYWNGDRHKWTPGKGQVDHTQILGYQQVTMNGIDPFDVKAAAKTKPDTHEHK